MYLNILQIPKQEYKQILELVATELSNKNKTSYNIELNQLSSIDINTLNTTINSNLAYQYSKNWKYENAERLKYNKEIEKSITDTFDIQKYLNGDNNFKEFFINSWINLFNACRVSYSVAIMKKIRKLRLERNLSQKEMANLLNMSSPAYGHYEQGQREPSLNTIIAISKIFNVSIDYLVDLCYSETLDNLCDLTKANHFSKYKTTLQESIFIQNLLKLGVTDEKLENLSKEQIKIIASIVKQN